MLIHDLASELAAIVACHGASLRHAARFEQPGYTRTLVDRTPGGELWLLGWQPDQATPIHDHGGVASASVVLAGSLIEENYRLLGSTVGGNGEVVFEGIALHTVGAFDLADRAHIHRVRAVGPTPTVSLHLYASTYASRTYELAQAWSARPATAMHALVA